jgi:NAD(P)-dependent dehydrogenase (short-subunit alcohol dehydrogenase family)
MCQAFQPLLKLSSNPKVINITSGLASITNSLTKPMQRAAPYGTSKVALNGLTAHLQVAENDRARERGNTVAGSKINYYAVAPGFLKTALTRFHERGKDPLQGAEAVVEILHSDEFPGGTQLEMEGGKLREIPW